MATSTTKNYNSWDLSNGMDVDYSGSKERKLADEEFQRGQKIIADAYEMDSYSATAQSNADKTNATNKAYVDTVGLATQAKNAEYQAYLDTVNGKVSSINSTNALLNATNISNLSDKNAQNEADDLVRQASGFTNIVNNNAQTTPEPVQQTPIVENPNSDLKNNFNQDTNKKFIVDNNGFVTKNNNYIENIQTNNQDNQLTQTQTNSSLANKQNNQVALQAQQPRLKTNLEVYEQAYAAATTQKAKFILQNNIRSEYIKQASASSYYDPVSALSMLNKAGITLPIDLRSRGDGTYNQKLPDGSTVNISKIDATLMVSDIINSTNKMLEKDQKQIADAQLLQKTIDEEKRDYEIDINKEENKTRLNILEEANRAKLRIEERNYDYKNNPQYTQNTGTATNTQSQQSMSDMLTGQSNTPNTTASSSTPISNQEFMGNLESSGDYKKRQENGGGYFGKYQFGASALVDVGLIKPDAYAKTQGKNFNQKAFLENPNNWVDGYSLDKFLNTPAMQDKAFIERQNATKIQIINILKSRGDETYNNPIKVQALVNAAHLVGVDGTNKKGERTGVMAVFKNGSFVGDSQDANGTKASSYYNKTIQNLQQSNNQSKLLLPVGTTLPETKVNNNQTQPKTITEIVKRLNQVEIQFNNIYKEINKPASPSYRALLMKTQSELRLESYELNNLYKENIKATQKQIDLEERKKEQTEENNKLKALLESTK